MESGPAPQNGQRALIPLLPRERILLAVAKPLTSSLKKAISQAGLTLPCEVLSRLSALPVRWAMGALIFHLANLLRIFSQDMAKSHLGLQFLALGT